MNKEIDELDRMTIGVREWAVQEAGYLHRSFPIEPTITNVVDTAINLEAYVLRNIATESGTDSVKEKI